MPCFPKEWSGPCPALCPGRAAAGEAGHWPLNHATAHFPLESTFNCSHAIKPSASKIELWLFLFVLFPWEGLRQGQEVWMSHQIWAGGLGDHSVVCGLWITFISIAWEPQTPDSTLWTSQPEREAQGKYTLCQTPVYPNKH